VARALMDRGFTLVRPLAGGLDGWARAGFPVDEDPDLIARRAVEGSSS
jgi:rhodanese-related sulfurtransferase